METKKEIEILTKASSKLYELKAILGIRLDKHNKSLEDINNTTISEDAKAFYISRVEYLINLDKRHLEEVEIIINDVEGLVRELYCK